MYMKKIMFSLLVVSMLSSVARASSEINLIKAELNMRFKNTKIDVIEKSEIPGLYTIVTGENIFYYNKETGYLLFGEILDRTGNSITAKKRKVVQESYFKQATEQLESIMKEDIFKKVAVKIGNGKNIIVEFTDPDCPYCRKLHTWFKGKEEIYTRYVILNPIPTLHPMATKKSSAILCSNNKTEMLHEVFDGKYDNQSVKDCETVEVKELLTKAGEYAKMFGASGTPTLMVNGKRVVGANTPLIEKLTQK